jgi:AcrR family transcriptional regulator
VPKISPAHEQQRRTQILQAAMACFARQGYHATSIDDVVGESGLSVGAIYSYFPSKEDLFLALSDHRSDQTLAYLNDLFHRPGPMADKTREAVDYLFDLLSDELLTEAQQQGQVRDDVDVDAAAELMMALNEGIVLLSVVGVRKVGLETLKPAYLSLLNAGLSYPTSSMFTALPAPALPTTTNGHHTGGA